MYYCSQRYYDPHTLSFISKDPARADGEKSAYLYCGGEPIGNVDPSGLEAITLSAGVTLGVSAKVVAYVIAGAIAVVSIVVIYNNAKKSKHRLKYDHPYHRFPKGYVTMVKQWKKLKGTKKRKLRWFAKHHDYRPHLHLVEKRTGKRVRTW